ncbi:MAG: ECF transporter S component [Spirochaetia bacterium]|jgi:hypothetical protein|nr:ECF transporter S component [Spirochaetia bacterium]
MNKQKRFLSSFSVFDLIISAMCAGMGVAIKPVIVPLIHIITGPLFIPGGAVAGGFYMIFIVLPAVFTGKRGTATLTCAVQVILVITTGVVGSHGIISIVTYMVPGVIVDLHLLIFRGKPINAVICIFAVLLANVSGSFLSNLVFFRLPFIPLMLTLFSAALSGGIGGFITWIIIKNLRQLTPFHSLYGKGGINEK